MKSPTKTATIAAEIALYGTTRTGSGYIARAADGRMFGDGETRPGRSFTEAVWIAVERLRQAGVVGTVAIFAPGGEHVAHADIGRPVPAFGKLTWTLAPVYVIPAHVIVELMGDPS